MTAEELLHHMQAAARKYNRAQRVLPAAVGIAATAGLVMLLPPVTGEKFPRVDQLRLADSRKRLIHAPVRAAVGENKDLKGALVLPQRPAHQHFPNIRLIRGKPATSTECRWLL
ncbi:MAG: hypothetical protein JWM59_3328 [Verrucomicrobiales bacterium]|nr:hypothetical protein [Verrucomicrobiales bacterium]